MRMFLLLLIDRLIERPRRRRDAAPRKRERERGTEEKREGVKEREGERVGDFTKKKPNNLRSTLNDFCNIFTAQIMGNKKKVMLLTRPHTPERTALVRISL